MWTLRRHSAVGMMGQVHAPSWTIAEQVKFIVLLSLVTIAWFSASPLRADDARAVSPHLNLIVESLERTEAQNPALSRSYQVTREYKIFRGNDSEPASDVIAQISFTPPDTKTFKIIKAHGNPRGEKIVRDLLEQEIEWAKEGRKGDISRLNYDFVFLRKEDFGVVPEYVLHIIPKRKKKGLLLGDIWVDAKTFRIRRVVAVPVKSPSFWIKDLHITVQFAAMNGMWIAVSVDAIARVRFLGTCTLSGLDLAPPPAASVAPKP